MIHAENERFRVSMLRGMACPLTLLLVEIAQPKLRDGRSSPEVTAVWLTIVFAGAAARIGGTFVRQHRSRSCGR